MSDMIDIINKHIENKKGTHIKNAIAPFGWDVVVKHLQECADEKYAGVPYGTLSYQLNQAEEVPYVRKVMDYLNDELDMKIFDAHIFTSFTLQSPTKVHADNHNVLLWSITGDMEVELWDDAERDPFYVEEFNKGDLFYIPAMVKHRVKVTGPRALVSFGLEVAEGQNYIDDKVDNPYYKKENEKEEDGTDVTKESN
jgi:mannose-6-phosphate isomerase-like protein (cupin superfamily)